MLKDYLLTLEQFHTPFYMNIMKNDLLFTF